MNALNITYFTLERIQIGDGWREPGDLVPEVATWAHIGAYIAQGKIAPVLVATLPQDVQDALAEYMEMLMAPPVPAGAAVVGSVEEEDEDEPEDDTTGDAEDEDEDEGEEDVDYDQFNVPELKAELDAREVDHKGITKKADLIALLEADDEAHADDEATDDDDD